MFTTKVAPRAAAPRSFARFFFIALLPFLPPRPPSALPHHGTPRGRSYQEGWSMSLAADAGSTANRDENRRRYVVRVRRGGGWQRGYQACPPQRNINGSKDTSRSRQTRQGRYQRCGLPPIQRYAQLQSQRETIVSVRKTAEPKRVRCVAKSAAEDLENTAARRDGLMREPTRQRVACPRKSPDAGR
jgi:hypothetical protein